MIRGYLFMYLLLNAFIFLSKADCTSGASIGIIWKMEDIPIQWHKVTKSPYILAFRLRVCTILSLYMSFSSLLMILASMSKMNVQWTYLRITFISIIICYIFMSISIWFMIMSINIWFMVVMSIIIWFMFISIIIWFMFMYMIVWFMFIICLLK